MTHRTSEGLTAGFPIAQAKELGHAIASDPLGGAKQTSSVVSGDAFLLKLFNEVMEGLQEQGAAARTLGFGETRAGFEFQAGQDRAARVAGELHDKKLLGIRNDYDIAQQKRDQAFSKGERLEAQKWQERMDKLQRDFQKEESQKDRDFQKEMKKEELKAERQRIFVDMMGKDPVRATLFALGIGGSILPGGERFEDLPALKGAKQQAGKTQEALSGLLEGTGVGEIRLGESGVTGLPPAIKSARSFQEAGASGKTVLTSAFGVGDIRVGKQPGINPEEFLQLIDSVTPKGTLEG